MSEFAESWPEEACTRLKSTGMARIIIAAGILGASAAAASALLFQPVDVTIFVFLIVALVPSAIAYSIIASYDGEVNARAPELFYDLSEHVRAGGSFARALRQVYGSSYGVMSLEVSRVLSEIEDEGYDIATSLKAMAARVNNAYVSRSVTIIVEALTTTPDVEGILKMVSAEGRLSIMINRERRSGILPSVLVMYLTTLILLIVVSLCITSLVPMSRQLTAMSAGTAFDDNPRDYALPYYCLSISVAVCSGLTVGVMRDGTACGGLKDTVLLSSLTFMVYEAVVFPGYNLMGALLH